MDYDITDIPAAYNRGHDHGPDVLGQWMNIVESHVDPVRVRTIVDLACGTGRYSPPLAERFNATVIGIDPSEKMLRQAQRLRVNRGRVLLAFGYGETLPIQTHSVDLIFISMVFHHFPNPVLVARECERILRPDGRVFLRTITTDRIPNYPYVQFFPSSRRILEQRLPSVKEACAAFEAASFRTLSAEIAVQQIAADYAEYAEKLATRTDSVLRSLDPSEFSAGLKSISDKHAAGESRGPILEPIDFMVFAKEKSVSPLL